MNKKVILLVDNRKTEEPVSEVHKGMFRGSAFKGMIFVTLATEVDAHEQNESLLDGFD